MYFLIYSRQCTAVLKEMKNRQKKQHFPVCKDEIVAIAYIYYAQKDENRQQQKTNIFLSAMMRL